jgi:hypothetical protein
LDKTDGLSCPGEAKCLEFKDNDVPTDAVESMTIGCKYGRMKGRTLENYCHNQVVTIKNSRLPDGSNRLAGCPLYETKSDNLSEALAHSIETAEQFRNFRELNLLPPLTEISVYEFTCFDAAERAVRKVNDEITKRANESDKKPDLSGTGEQMPKRRTGGRP